MYRFKGKTYSYDFFKYLNLLAFNWNSIKTFGCLRPKSIVIKLKGTRGVSKNVGYLVRQRAPKLFNYSVTDMVSTNLFKIKPSISIGSFNKIKGGRNTTLFSTGGGLLFYDSTVRYSLFDYYLWDVFHFIPRSISTIATQWLVSFRLGSKLKSLKPFQGGLAIFARSLGSSATLHSYDFHSGEYLVKLPSGSFKLFFLSSLAVSFDDENDKARSVPLFYQNAGFSGSIGRKPKVRGVAMNPVDHPHGGRAKSVRFQRTPWGWPTKG